MTNTEHTSNTRNHTRYTRIYTSNVRTHTTALHTYANHMHAKSPPCWLAENISTNPEQCTKLKLNCMSLINKLLNDFLNNLESTSIHEFVVDYKLHSSCRLVQVFINLWEIYLCFFIPYCTQKPIHTKQKNKIQKLTRNVPVHKKATLLLPKNNDRRLFHFA